MSIENPIKLLRELKGAPLSVLFALAIVHQPVNAGWLETVTGYSNASITNALRLLIEFNYCLKISGQKWQIANNIQLPLAENHKNHEISDTTSSSAVIEEKRVYKGKEEEEEEKIIKSMILERLEEIGIGEPMRSRLARMKHIDIEYLNAHYEEWKKQDRWGLGLLIHKLINKDPKPKSEIERNNEYYRRFLH